MIRDYWDGIVYKNPTLLLLVKTGPFRKAYKRFRSFLKDPIMPRSYNSGAPSGILLSTFHLDGQATGLVLTLAGDTLVMEEVNPQIDR